MQRIAWLLALTLTAALLAGCVYDPYTGTYRPCCGYYGYYGYPYYRYPSYRYPPYYPYGYSAPYPPPAPNAAPPNQPGPNPPPR